MDRFCTDCLYMEDWRPEGFSRRSDDYHCGHPDLVSTDPVTGERALTTCHHQRGDGATCGPEGELFESKEVLDG